MWNIFKRKKKEQPKYTEQQIAEIFDNLNNSETMRSFRITKKAITYESKPYVLSDGVKWPFDEWVNYYKVARIAYNWEHEHVIETPAGVGFKPSLHNPQIFRNTELHFLD